MADVEEAHPPPGASYLHSTRMGQVSGRCTEELKARELRPAGQRIWECFEKEWQPPEYAQESREVQVSV